MSQSELIVGLDVGTTSAKALVFDADGRALAASEHTYPLREPVAGAAEQDPAEVVEAALSATAAAIDQIDARRVAGIALSTAMHAVAGLDAADEPVTPLLTWADRRAAAQAQRLREHHPELHARTGTPPHSMAPLAKLMWLAENRPELHARARRFVGVKELIVHRLTGRWLIDRSCASGTGLMDLERGVWDAEALAVAGVGAQQLCPIVPVTERLRLAHGGLGAPAGAPVIVGAGDGPLANLGLGSVSPGMAACSIGTSGALRLTVAAPSLDAGGALFCYALAPGRWVLGGATSNGGSVLPWLGRTLGPDLGPEDADALLALAAEVAPGSDGLIMLPYLLGERAPHWDEQARGAYVGLRHSHGRGHLIRAAIEGVCLQLALVLDAIRDAGHQVTELRATGGFARSAWWRQLLSDVLGMEVAYATGAQGSALGAALLGRVALGLSDSIEQAAAVVRIGERRAPEAASAALYAELRPVFRALYDDLSPALRALSRLEGRSR